jgi:hypothetical protein
MVVVFILTRNSWRAGHHVYLLQRPGDQPNGLHWHFAYDRLPQAKHIEEPFNLVPIGQWECKREGFPHPGCGLKLL